MKKFRDVIVLLAVFIAFVASLTMLRRVVGVASPWFGLMVMLDFLGMIAFGRALFALKLPGFLRNVRNWEVRGSVYKAMHVPAFGAMLRRSPLRYLNPLVYVKQYSELSAVQSQIESSEAAHLLAAALLVRTWRMRCHRTRGERWRGSQLLR